MFNLVACRSVSKSSDKNYFSKEEKIWDRRNIETLQVFKPSLFNEKRDILLVEWIEFEITFPSQTLKDTFEKFYSVNKIPQFAPGSNILRCYLYSFL